MIIGKIIIREINEGKIGMVFDPEWTGATPEELRWAYFLTAAMQATAEFMVSEEGIAENRDGDFRQHVKAISIVMKRNQTP